MKSFQFIIKDNNAKAFRLFFWFLLFLHVTAAAVVVLFASNNWLVNVALSGIILYSAATLLYYFFREKKYAFIAYQFFSYLIFTVFWLLQSGIIVMLFCAAIIYVSYVLQTKKSLIIFCAEEIVVKRIFSSKHFSWDEIEHVILKDKILTIDFTSNKFIQVEVVNEEAYDENIFNAFVTNKNLES